MPDKRSQLVAELCGGAPRKRLLETLYGAPDVAFSLRPLAAAAGVDPSNALRTLRRFIEAGLVDRVGSAERPQYRAARGPMFEAVRGLFANARPDPMRVPEERSLRLHELAIDHLRSNPNALSRARATLDRWLEQGQTQPDLLEWRRILNGSLEEIAQIALQRTAYGARMRKSSPLSVLVRPAERESVYASARS